jgi:hypothetical protein
MRLRAIDIGIVPEPGADRMGLIGLPTWMWVNQPDAHTWGPITRSVSAGGVTATVTARVDRVVWDMGDGATVTCATPGTPYEDHYGNTDSPDCGHRYTRTSVGEPQRGAGPVAQRADPGRRDAGTHHRLNRWCPLD